MGSMGSGGAGETTGGGGARVDGGSPDVPLSQGDFPYPGRWWGVLTGNVTLDAGTYDDGPFVIHWSADDPTDRGLWTSTHVYPLIVSAAADGSTTLLMQVPETSGCWSIYPTSDPSTLQAQPCNYPPSSGVKPLGFFQNKPRLLAEIPLPPLTTSTAYVSTGLISTNGVDDGGQWVVFSVGSELWYWRASTGDVFDLGASNDVKTVALSSDGNRVLFLSAHADPGVQYSSLYSFDTTTATATELASSVYAAGEYSYASVATFSPDGSRAAFYANTKGSSADLVVYDFTTGTSVTLAPRVRYDAPTDSAVAFLGSSGDHVVFGATDATMSFDSGQIATFGYDFTTGRTMSFGPASDLTPFPGHAYVAFQTITSTTTGQVMLIDDASWTPRVLETNTGPSGVWPDPTGQKVAYSASPSSLDVLSVAEQTPLVINDDTLNFSLVTEPPPADELTSPDRPVAALFTESGAVVHELIDSTTNMTEIGYYDATTQQETAYPITITGTPSPVLFTALGDTVLSNGSDAMAVVWPNPPVALGTIGSSSLGATFVFSAGDRYLTYEFSGYLTVLDSQTGVTTRLVSLDPRNVTVTSPITGVSVVVQNPDSPLVAYLPDGTSWTLASLASGPLINPSGSYVAYATASGTTVAPLQAGATGTVVGGGGPLLITDTQVILRDLDGVCVIPLPGS
jgi:hypothetical protein